MSTQVFRAPTAEEIAAIEWQARRVRAQLLAAGALAGWRVVAGWIAPQGRTAGA